MLPTSAGKTHIVRTLGACLGGVVLIFVPLLALLADVLAKFTSGNDCYGTVEAQNLDEIKTNAYGKYKQILRRLETLKANTSSTVFLSVSPHFLVDNADARKALLAAARNKTLRLVVIDKVHLHMQQGMTF